EINEPVKDDDNEEIFIEDTDKELVNDNTKEGYIQKSKFIQETLKEFVNLSPAENEISDHFKNFNNIIMDLRPRSKFSDSKLQESAFHLVLDPIDNYITEEINDYLNEFFGADLSPKGWDEAVNKLYFNETDSDLLKNVKKLMKATLPKFLKAFILGATNPLRDASTFEKPHLNQFVHPLIDSAFWIFANINYVFGGDDT
ncbi:15498_t:CDS:2, partial [Funneliformis geosporum]